MTSVAAVVIWRLSKNKNFYFSSIFFFLYVAYEYQQLTNTCYVSWLIELQGYEESVVLYTMHNWSQNVTVHVLDTPFYTVIWHRYLIEFVAASLPNITSADQHNFNWPYGSYKRQTRSKFGQALCDFVCLYGIKNRPYRICVVFRNRCLHLNFSEVY